MILSWLASFGSYYSGHVLVIYFSHILVIFWLYSGFTLLLVYVFMILVMSLDLTLWSLVFGLWSLISVSVFRVRACQFSDK